MTYITMEYLKEILPKEHYENILKNFSGCLIYVSKKEYEDSEDKKIYNELLKMGLKPSDAIKRMARIKDMSERNMYYKKQKGLFDE